MKSESFELANSVRLMEEAEQTLHAIREGAVDAFVVEEPEGHRVYTLEGSDLPYSSLVEGMQQGAAMLDAQGCIIYCNQSLAQLLHIPRESIVGMLLEDLLDAADRDLCKKLLNETQLAPSQSEMRIRRADGTITSAEFSFRILSQVKSAIGVLVTDLTAHKQLAELAARLQGMQDEERRRLARELHDSVGQLLAAIGMNIGIVQAQVHKLDPLAARAISDNSMLVEQVSREIRTISHLLHPPLLDIAGLASAIRWYVDGFSERSKIKVDLEIPADFGRLPSEIEIAVFRIVQECLTNIHRHSGSATANIRIHQEGDQLAIEVRDNGKGIPLEKQRELTTSTRGGVGFGGMRERLKLLGGTLDIQSQDTGTVVSATLKVA
jgi:PAS domain S-box-containing protein